VITQIIEVVTWGEIGWIHWVYDFSEQQHYQY